MITVESYNKQARFSLHRIKSGSQWSEFYKYDLDVHFEDLKHRIRKNYKQFSKRILRKVER